ncbi:MAG: T9SS type A sorting domain-containing protein [Bacteroidales bacterium]|nr:T9SS type A sorting domain-containing protein [Bacteroidales bacterium]
MKAIVTSILSIVILVGIQAQDPGELDLTFGINGISRLPLNFSNNIETISVLPDDHIITGGQYFEEDYGSVCVSAKLDENGTMINYGSTGTVEHNFNPGVESECIYASQILPNGKIILAGHQSTPANVFVMQLLSDGTFDASFSGDGIFTDDSFSFKVNNIEIFGDETNYTIAVCGTDNGYDIPQIIMLNQEGYVVSGFGTGGLYQMTEHDGEFLDIVIDPANSCFYGCGYEWLSPDAFVSKHQLSTGTLIEEFGTNGIYTFSGLSSHIRTETMLMNEAANLITAFGYLLHPDGDNDIFGIRLNASDGTLDETFGIGGFSSLRIPGQDEFIEDAVSQGDEKYYVGGHTFSVGDGADFMVGRILNNGYADPSFGSGGFTVVDIDNHDQVKSIALSNDESKLYAGGMSGYGNPYYTGTIACFHTGYTVGIAEKKSEPGLICRVYPNPANEIITIETGNEDTYTIEVYDLAGKLLKSETLFGENLHLNVSGIHEGMYLLNVISGNKFIKSSKIIIQ